MKRKLNSLIYIFCNKLNGKKYIGQTINFNGRFRGHLKESRKQKPNFQIAQAIKKYGIENFYIIKIQYPKEELGYWEKYYIEFFNTFKNGYNADIGIWGTYEKTEIIKKKISDSLKGRYIGDKNPFFGKNHSKDFIKRMSGCGNPMYGKTHTDEAKKKISMANKGNSPWNTGKVMSDKYRKDMSRIKKGKKPYEMTDKIRKKISNNHYTKKENYISNRARKFIAISPDGKSIEFEKGILEFCRIYKLHKRMVTNVLNGIQEKTKGWRFVEC